MEIENFVEELKENKNRLYSYIVENYYKLSKEELRDLLLNAIIVADNDVGIIEETIQRYDFLFGLCDTTK